MSAARCGIGTVACGEAMVREMDVVARVAGAARASLSFLFHVISRIKRNKPCDERGKEKASEGKKGRKMMINSRLENSRQWSS